MPDRQFDSLEFSRSLYSQSTRSRAFSARSAEEARRWQSEFAPQLTSLLGHFPAKRCDLHAEIAERKEFGDHVRETVYFQSRDNLSVFAYLLLPKNSPRPAPVIICLPGHGRGVDDIVGIAQDDSQRATPGYQKDFALQAVQHGYAALAIEMLGFGHRRDEHARKSGPGASSCQPAAGAALIFGSSMAGWRTWDVMRGIDYLETRPEVDAKRIACMGISGGGTVTLYAAALDPRIKVAVMSCSFCTFADSIMSISHCIDNYVPGVLSLAEMSDVAGLIAPRAFFSEAGVKDTIFPLEGVRRSVADLRRIYEILGVPEKVGFEEFDADHQFWGKGAFSYLGHWL